VSWDIAWEVLVVRLGDEFRKLLGVMTEHWGGNSVKLEVTLGWLEQY
jgi:hypothetical protein